MSDYLDSETEIARLVFFSGKLSPLFYKQTYNDIEFFAYASALRDFLYKFIKELKNIDKIERE